MYAFIDWIQEVFRRDNLSACRRSAVSNAMRGDKLVESRQDDSSDGVSSPSRQTVEA